MGTASTFLALALARMGHSVEMLNGVGHDVAAVDPEWGRAYADAGVRLRSAPPSEEPVEPWHFGVTRNIELGLRDEPPDVVIAHEFGGPAYSALQLRQAGLAFENTLFVVFCHGSRRYIYELSRDLGVPDLAQLLDVSVHEQASVELADVVVSPSAYLLDWMRDDGWQLPERSFVIPYFTRSSATGEEVPKAARGGGDRLRLLAFFGGRLDDRKGIKEFAAALNAIEPNLLEGIELELIGKTSGTWPRERIESLLSPAAKRALRSVVFETALDQQDALARLSRPGTLAVMPSLQENSPNAVYECLEYGIPFIASSVGGVPELIASEDHERVLFEPTAEGVEAALRRALSGAAALEPAHASFSGTAPYERWAEVIEMHPHPRPQPREQPPVDVVVVHRHSQEELSRCLLRLERGVYPNANVIVAEGSSVEAARQKAVRQGSAPYVLFLDEADVPEAVLVETLVRAQDATDADVVSCGMRLEHTDGGSALHFFSGDVGGLGALSNGYGGVALFSRSVLSDATGEWPAETDADWPLLAGLAGSGANIVSVPLPLVTRRARPASVERNPCDALLVLHQLEHALPREARSLARLAGGLAGNTPPPAPERRGSFLYRALRRVI